MADIGINFRATSGYVTDGANETYCLGHADAYPTTRGGVTFGWNIVVNSRDRVSGNDRRLAGMNFTGNTGRTFRIDLPSTGAYNVHLAAGDGSNPQPVRFDLYDNATLFASITGSTSVANHFHDATDADLTNATWPGSEVAVARTFSSTIFFLKVVDANNNSIAHIRIVSAASGNRRRRVLCGANH